MLEVLELLLVEARDEACQLEALDRIAGALELGGVDADQVLPAVLADVDRLEHLGGERAHVGIHQEALERRQRDVLGRVARQRRRVVVDRRLDVAQLLLVDLAELHAQLDRLVDRGREAEPPLVELDDVGPPALLAVQRLERLDRVATLGRELHHLLPRADRVVRAPQRREQAGGLDHRGHALVGVVAGAMLIGLAHQDVDEALVVVGVAVDRLERGERAPVVGLTVEHLLVVLARELVVLADRAREVGDVEVEPALDVGVEHVRRDVAVRVDQIAFARQLAGEPLGLAHDRAELGLGRGDAQRLQLGRERARLVRELLLPQAHDLAERPQLRRRVVAPLREPPVQPREPIVLRGLLVHRLQQLRGDHPQLVVVERGLERAERGRRERATRLELEHAAPAIERLDLAAERAGEQLRDLDVEADATPGRRGDLALEDVEQIGVAAGLPIQARELAERLRVVLVAVEQLEVCGDRLVGLAEHDLVHLGDAHEQRAGVGHRAGVQLAAQHVDQLAPFLGALVQALERVERAGVGRLVLQHVAPRRDRGGAIAELVLLERGHARQQRAALVRILGPLGLAARDVAQRLPPLLLFVEARERRAGLADRRRARRIGVEQAAVGVDRLDGVAELHVVVGRELGEQRGAGRDVGGRCGGRGGLERGGRLGPARQPRREPG